MLMNKEYRDEQRKELVEGFNYYLETEFEIYDSDLKAELADVFLDSDGFSHKDILDYIEDYKLRQQEDE